MGSLRRRPRRPRRAATRAGSESAATRSSTASATVAGTVAAAVAPSGEQLLDEERVAARERVQLVGERGRHGAAGDRLELAGDVVAVERLEIEPGHERPPRQLGHEPPRRMLARKLAGAVRERERDRLGAQVAGQERHEVPRRAVGPVDVLEHDQQRPASPPPGRAARARARTAGPARTGRRRAVRRPRPQPREQRRECAARVVVERPVVERQLAQRRDHGRVRELLAAELEALAVQHEEPGSRPRASSSPTRRVLPTPGSPAISASCGAPSAASSSRPASVRNGSSRPTIARLETWRRCTCASRPERAHTVSSAR